MKRNSIFDQANKKTAAKKPFLIRFPYFSYLRIEMSDELEEKLEKYMH